jgi:antitoxin YefM
VQAFFQPSAKYAVTLSYARKNLKAVLDKVTTDRAPIVIARQRGEGVVVISATEWASIEETNYLLRSPRNAERLLDSIRCLEAGEGEEHRAASASSSKIR